MISKKYQQGGVIGNTITDSSLVDDPTKVLTSDDPFAGMETGFESKDNPATDPNDPFADMETGYDQQPQQQQSFDGFSNPNTKVFPDFVDPTNYTPDEKRIKEIEDERWAKAQQRQRDLRDMFAAIGNTLPANMSNEEIAQIKIEDINTGSSVYSPLYNKTGRIYDSPNSNLKKATLPNGETRLFTTKANAQDILYETGLETAKSLSAGTSSLLELANNASRWALENSPLAPVVPAMDYLGSKVDKLLGFEGLSKEEEELKQMEGLNYSPWTNKIRDAFDKGKINITPDEGYLNNEKELAEAENNGEKIWTNPHYWKNVFTDEFLFNDALPGAESMGEFLIPGIAIGKAGLVSKAMKGLTKGQILAAREAYSPYGGSIDKAVKLEKLYDAIGVGGDIITGGFINGSLESHIEGETNAEQIAVDYYNKEVAKAGFFGTNAEISDNPGVKTLEDILNSPDDSLKQETLDIYKKAYKDIYNANIVPLTITNTLPLMSIIGKGVFKGIGGAVERFAIRNPITTAGGELALNSINEGHQEMYQQGVQSYETDKINSGHYPIDETALEAIWNTGVDIKESWKRGAHDLSRDPATLTATLLGSILGFGGVAYSEVSGAYKQTKTNSMMKELIKNTPSTDYSSLQGLRREDGTIDMVALASKVGALNKHIINDEFASAASKLQNKELIDYSYQQGASGLIYEALKAGVDEQTAKTFLRKVLTDNLGKSKMLESSDGSMKKSSKVIEEKMELLDNVFKVYEMAQNLKTEYKLPEKHTQALFESLIGRQFFEETYKKHVEELDKINAEIKAHKELKTKELIAVGQLYREGVDQETGHIEDYTVYGKTFEPLTNLYAKRTRIGKKASSAYGIFNKYDQTAQLLLDPKRINSSIEENIRIKVAQSIANKVKETKYRDIEEIPLTSQGSRWMSAYNRVAHKIATETLAEVSDSKPKDVVEQTVKELDKLENEFEGKLKLELFAQSYEDGATRDQLVNPKGKNITSAERDLREKIYQQLLTEQQEEAGEVPRSERYIGRPLLLEFESKEFLEEATPEDINNVNQEFVKLKGLPPAALTTGSFDQFLNAPVEARLQDPDYQQAVHNYLIGATTNNPTISQEPITSKEESKETNLEKETKQDFIDATEEQQLDNESLIDEEAGPPNVPEKPLAIEEKERVRRNRNVIRVFHKSKPNGSINGRQIKDEDIPFLYHKTFEDWEKAMSYLHMGLFTPGDLVTLEIEPDLLQNQRETNWKNTTIQVVTYNKGDRIVIGSLAFYNQYTATEQLETLRKDIFNQWVGNQGIHLKTKYQAPIKEVYKGHVPKTPYIKGDPEASSKPTDEVLRELEFPLSDVEYGIVIGDVSKNEIERFSTNSAYFDAIPDRNTKDADKRTGFPYLLLKSHKAHSTGEYHYEQFALYTKRVEDIPGYTEKILELIATSTPENLKDHIAQVQALVKFTDKTTKESGPTWYIDKLTGKPAITFRDQQLVGAEAIYNKYKLGDRPAHIDFKDVRDHTEVKDVVHPVLGEKSIKDIILAITKTNIDATKVNVYHYNGVTKKSPFYDAKISVGDFFVSNNSLEGKPIQETKPEPSTKEINKEEIRPTRPKRRLKVTKAQKHAIWENNTKSKEWFKTRLEEIGYFVSDKELAKIHSVLGLKNSDKIWGIAQDAAVTLATRRPEGTTRHEAFHIVFNLFLTDQQREKAFRELWDLVRDPKHPKYETFKNYTQEDFERAIKEDLFGSRTKDKYSIGSNAINYVLKSADILQSQKAIDWFKKRDKAQWKGDLFYTKLSTELGIPKDQVEILKGLNLSNPYNREELLSNLLANYGFQVEVNTAVSNLRHIDRVETITQEEFKNVLSETSFDGDGYQEIFSKVDSEALYYEYGPIEGPTGNVPRRWEKHIFKGNKPVSQVYSNMTSPGGTNYRELRFTTPQIEPSIKGHAQFADKNDIGWARVDETNIKLSEEEINRNLREIGISSTTTNEKVRRILEIQSDLFQKGRELEDLANVTEKEKDTFRKLRDEEFFDKARRYLDTRKENQFLQLLNKHNTWVTFFVKSLIQDSIKQGYDKVLFPSGDTASKIEGHTTLEEFKKDKERRIKANNKLIEEHKIDLKNATIKEDTANIEHYNTALDTLYRENIRYEEELKQIEGPEGLAAFAPINFFYENTIKNILNKISKVNEITDEYGNKWFEVDLTKEEVQSKVNPVKLKTTAQEFYQTQDLLTQLEEVAANAFEFRKETNNFPEWLDKYPKLKKILEELYNFILTKLDVLQQYLRPEARDIEDLFRQIENNSFGRDFMGKRRKSYQEVFNENLTKNISNKYSIKSIASADITQRISLVNKELIPRVLLMEKFFSKETEQPQTLYDLLTYKTKSTLPEDQPIGRLKSVYQEVKNIITNSKIPFVQSEIDKYTEANDQDNLDYWNYVKGEYENLEKLISLDFIEGKAAKYQDGSQEDYEFTRRLLNDLNDSQGVVVRGKSVLTDRKVEVKEGDNTVTKIEKEVKITHSIATEEELENERLADEGRDEDDSTYDNSSPAGQIGKQEIDSLESWQFDSFLQNAYEKISANLKKEISNIPQMVLEEGSTTNYIPETDTIGGIIFNNPIVIFDKLVEKISSSRSMQEMLSKLETLRASDKKIDFLMAKIESYQEEDHNKLLKDLWLGIGNKYKVKYLMNLSRSNNVTLVESARKDVVTKIMTNFNARFYTFNWDLINNSKLSNIGELTYDQFKALLDEKDTGARATNIPILLKNLGFEISEETEKYFLNNKRSDNDKVYRDIEYIYTLMSKNINPINFKNPDGTEGAHGRIKAIATTLRESDPSVDLKMFTNGKNKLVSGHVAVGLIVKQLHSLRTDILNNVNKETRQKAIDDFVTENKYLFLEDSPFVNWIREGRQIGLDLAFMDSRKRNNSQEGAEITEMKNAEIAINKFEYWVGGLTTPKTTPPTYSWTLKKFRNTYYNVAIFDSPKTYFMELPFIESTEDVLSILEGVWRQERNRIDYLKSQPEGYTTGNKNMDQNGKIFHFFPGIGLENINSWGLAKEKIREFLARHYQNYIEQLENYDLVKQNKETGVVEATGMPNLSLPRDNKSFSETLELYWYNEFLMNTQTITMFSGDPANYGKNKNDELTSGDYQKRNKAFHANGIYGAFEPHETTYSVVYLKDEYRNSREDFYNQVRELMSRHFTGDALEASLAAVKPKEDLKDAHNITDAQGYISLDRWKSILKAFNQWSKPHQEMYERLKAGNPTPQDIFVVSQPIKPHAYGFQESKVDSRFKQPYYDKYSAIVLHEDLVKDNPTLRGIMEKMELHDISEVLFESGSKAAKTNVISLEDLLDDNKALLVSQSKHARENRFYKEQQKVPEHYLESDNNNLLGIQFRKLVKANLNRTKVYSNDKDLTTIYDILTKPETITQNLTGLHLETMIDRLQELNIREDRLKLDSVVRDLNAFRNKLIASIDEKSLGSQHTNALDIVNINGKKEFKIPLSYPLVSRKFEEIISSWYKKVSKQTHNGNSYVNASSLGWDHGEHGLQIKFEKDGTYYVEVAMPKNKLLHGVNLHTGEIEKVQEGIVYRIPTEEKYSMFPIKVVKWLEPTVGGIIIMPVEATTLAGLDFDIDKVYALQYNFRVKSGKVIVSKDVATRKGKENVLLDVYRTLLKDENTFKDFIRKQDTQPLKDLRDIIAGTNTFDPIALPQSQTKFLARNQAGKDLIGIFANLNSFHALAQGSGANIDSYKLNNMIFTGFLAEFKNEFDENGKPKNPKGLTGQLGREFDTNGDQISRAFAMLLAAAVDNAKDPILDDLNINTFTASMLGMLMAVGVDINTAIRRINQPDILEATKLFYNKGRDEALKNPAVKELYELSATFSKLISAMRVDSGVGPVLHDIDKKLTDIRDVHDSQTVYPGTLLPKIEIGEREDGTQFYYLEPTNEAYNNKATREYIQILIDEVNFTSTEFPYFRQDFREHKDILNRYQKKGFSMSSKARRRADMEHMAILHYKLFNIQNPYNFIQEFPGKFLAFQADYLKNNNPSDPYWDLFNIFSISKEGIIHLTDKNSIDKKQQEIISEKWASAINSSREEVQDMARDLIKYGFMINGYNYTRDSYFHLNPIEFFTETPGFREFTPNYQTHLNALFTALNNPQEYLPKFYDSSFTHENPEDLKNLISESKKVEGEMKDYYLPMYAKKKETDDTETQSKVEWEIYLNQDFVNSGYSSTIELESPKYTKVVWKDPIIKGRTYDVDSFETIVDLSMREKPAIPVTPASTQPKTTHKIKLTSSPINFQEEQTSGYKNRTIKNASADATIAIAVDFNSAGEKLTKSAVQEQGKMYIPINANNLEVTQERVDEIVKRLNSVNAKTLNIAGNGIYTMKGKYTQEQVDNFTFELLQKVLSSPNLKTPIELIRSGGQTGFDEAGAKAGARLGYPTLILAPKGWKFRNAENQDISNEQQFKQRFEDDPNNFLDLGEDNDSTNTEC